MLQAGSGVRDEAPFFLELCRVDLAASKTLLQDFQGVGGAERNLTEVERLVRGYFHDRDNLEPVSRKKLRRRLSQVASHEHVGRRFNLFRDQPLFWMKSYLFNKLP